MKHRNNVLTVTLVALAVAFAPIVGAAPSPDGGPIRVRADAAPSPDGGPAGSRIAPIPRVQVTPAPRPNTSPVNLAANETISAESEASSADSVDAEDKRMPVITIHCVDNVTRGKTGAFVLNMNPAIMLSGMYVKFSVTGTAVQGLDYVALVSPAHIGESGYGLIQIQTLPDKRAFSVRQAYSVVVTLENAAGYSVGYPGSATMWIKP